MTIDEYEFYGVSSTKPQGDSMNHPQMNGSTHDQNMANQEAGEMEYRWERIHRAEPLGETPDVFTVGPARLQLSDAEFFEDKQYQLVEIRLHEFAEATRKECRKTWPLRALELMKAAVAEMERELNNDSD